MQIKNLYQKVFFHFFYQLMGLTGISIISRYQRPDLKEVNWDITLFLTPLGMLKNFTSENPVMRSFYTDFSKEQIELAQWQVLIICGILLLQIANFTKLVRALK